MTDSVERQLRSYFDQLEQQHGPVTFRADPSDNANRNEAPHEEILMIDNQDTDRHRSGDAPLSKWWPLAVAAVAIMIVGLGVALLGGDDDATLEFIDETEAEATPAPEPTTASSVEPTPELTTEPTTEPMATATPDPDTVGDALLRFRATNYTLSIDSCDVRDEFFEAEGRYDGPNGRWLFSFIEDSRTDWDDDGQIDVITSVRLGTGRPDYRFEYPQWESNVNPLADPPQDGFSYERTGGVVVASGEIFDTNSIDLPQDETLPFTLELTCPPAP